MCQSSIVLQRYWVENGGYFSLATTVLLGVGITYVKPLLFHGIPQERKDKKISIISYTNIIVYEFFKNPFPADCGIPYLNLPPVPIDDISHQNKKSCYTYDFLPDAIFLPLETILVLLPPIMVTQKVLSLIMIILTLTILSLDTNIVLEGEQYDTDPLFITE